MAIYKKGLGSQKW